MQAARLAIYTSRAEYPQYHNNCSAARKRDEKCTCGAAATPLGLSIRMNMST